MGRKATAMPPTSQARSTMEFDVAQAQASANPGSYSGRWQVSAEGHVIPRTGTANESLPMIRTEANKDGSMDVFLPQLAQGTAGYANPWATATSTSYPLMNLAAPPESNTFGDSEYFGMWDTVLDQRDGKWNLRRAMRWWQRDPLVFRCIRLLCQLANTRVTFKSEDEDAQELVENWFKQAMPHSFKSAFFLEFFRTGYVPVLKTLITYEPRNYKDGKIPKAGPSSNIEDHTYIPARAELTDPKESARAEATITLMTEAKAAAKEYEEAFAKFEQMKSNYDKGLCSAQRLDWYQGQMNAKQYRWLKGQVPGGYTILDPLLVDLKGPQSMQWLREPYLQVSGDLIAAVINPTALQKMMIDRLPKEIVQQIRDGATYVWLSPNICQIVCQDRQPYERYPTPMMRHCFDALDMKYDIHAMDQATVRGVKNRVLLVKIGNDTYPVTDPIAIQNVASIFNSVGRTGTFFWSHTIEMEWIEPDLSSFADENKYKHVNSEIRTCFGITPMLTGDPGKGGTGSSGMVSFKPVEQEVTFAQNAFLEMLNKEIRMLKAALGISAEIQVDFERINLKDEMQFWTVITQAVMNGILDHETALETLGFHFPQIKQRMEKMQPLKKKGIFVPSPSANNLGPDGSMKPQGAGAGGRQKNTKPPGKNKSKAGKAQPKKKAKASMRAVGDEVYVLVEAMEGGFDQDQRDETARLFGTKQDFVLTTAEFQEKFPSYDLSPEWPDLNPLETIAATMQAAKISTSTDDRFEQACAEFKKSNPGDGPRGPYLTPQKKAELRQQAFAAASLDGFKLITNVPELPKAWEKHYDTTKKAMAEVVPAEYLDAHAFAMTAMRFKKSKAM